MEIVITLIVLTLVISYIIKQMNERNAARRQPRQDDSFPGESRPAGKLRAAHEELFALAESLEEFARVSAYPSDLLERPEFREGVELLASEKFSAEEVLSYASGVNVIIGCMALETLSRRDDVDHLRDVVLSNLNDSYYWKRYFFLRVLNKRVDEPVIGEVLRRLDENWLEQVPLRSLKEFMQERIGQGEVPSFANLLEDVSEEDIKIIEDIVKELGKELNTKLLVELQEWRNTSIDRPFLRSLGRFWFEDGEVSDKIWIKHDYLLKRVLEIETSLRKTPPRPVVLVGDSGVGKTAVARVLGQRLKEKGWVIFEAGAMDLLAGQVYIGELEKRMQQLVRKIGGRRKVLWIVPNFHELMWAGSHRHNPTGVMDMVYPYLEKGEIVVLGETHPIAFERMLQNLPRLRSSLDIHLLQPLSMEETIKLARAWVDRIGSGSEEPFISEDTLQEAFQLTRQYLGDKAAPGNLLQFLELSRKRLSRGGDSPSVPITIDDMLLTLTHLTGLPVTILDERQGLDLDALGELFHNRVMGQPEAVDCLVERVAMIKAGVTDPTRPQGVFLFAGPTGTGKTEIAKTLAEFLFGSPQRMIRLDMSEFKNPDSIDRILGEQGKIPQQKALVDLIRKQPFSVMLLDEFEKADPNVWDLFLQVFDDGRLTDKMGNTADFRHCIIIMTSNLGGVIPRGASIGFVEGANIFTATNVARAIEQTFRKEFINRIDRMVIFQPLSRSVMREVLRKELNEVLQRRGLRSRAWAVEFHDSALEFLLDRGFTADLGARPLKRAIERYLLSPLALTIVNHQFPEGDQFLFVRSTGKKIEVEFIDPDAPEKEEEQAIAADTVEVTRPLQLRLEDLILDPRGSAAETGFLKERYDQLAAQIEGKEWQGKKGDALAQISIPGFWESPERFAILGLAEYMDRIKAGFATAARLFERLIGPEPGKRTQFSAVLLQRLAHQLYLLESAVKDVNENQPQDAFLLVEAGRDSAVEDRLNDEFARKIARMYQQWAEKRRMRHKLLEETGGDGKTPYRMMLAVAGYAAYGILEKEAGMHVWEIPTGSGKSFQRCKVYVQVVPQPVEPAGNEPDSLLKQAQQEFAGATDEGHLTIVRRYREEPSPLVRNGIKNWRSGRLDRVLGGDFDLMG
jgi:ATP-dependent Clp protease ATP-binding subunit ClpC